MTVRINRRKLLQSGMALGVLAASKSLFPSWMPSMAFATNFEKAPGDVLITIFLRGGMDGLSVVAPYFEGSNYFDVRPTIALPEPSSGGSFDLDGRFSLHPAMAGLKELFDDQALAIIHATGSTDPSRSHFDAMQYMEYGTPGIKTTSTGWLGRHLETASWNNKSPFRAVGMGSIVAQSLRGSIPPLALQSINEFHYKGRESEFLRLEAKLRNMYSVYKPQDVLDEQAKLVFETLEVLEKLRQQPYQSKYEYPDTDYGRGLKQLAQLIKADLGLEVANIDLDGWDTHEHQGTLEGEFANTVRELSEGLEAFYQDMAEKMKNISIVVMSEFGRRVEENASAGTDHGHGNIMLALGGGIKGGKVYGDWPGLSKDSLDSGDLAITTDYRDVLAEIVKNRLLNNNIQSVFPNHDYKPLGITKTL